MHATRIAAGEAKLVLGVRHADGRRLRGARQDAEGRDQGAGQHRAGHARAVHARTRPALSDGVDGAGDQGRGRTRRRRIPRRDQARHRLSWAIRSRPTCSWSATRTSAGCIPLCEASILRAIELNGDGRSSRTSRASTGDASPRSIQPRVAAAAIPAAAKPDSQRLSQSLDEMIERRVKFLTDYQDAAYAKRYRDLVAAGARGGSARHAGHHRTDRGRRALLLQAARDQGRVRSRAPVRRVRFRAARRRAVRRRLQAALPSRATDLQQARRQAPASRRSRPTARGC